TPPELTTRPGIGIGDTALLFCGSMTCMALSCGFVGGGTVKTRFCDSLTATPEAGIGFPPVIRVRVNDAPSTTPTPFPAPPDILFVGLFTATPSALMPGVGPGIVAI